ncbi:MAG: DNA photolyase family protein, partial [Candidatus Eremiobacteraeota bacterium]|nr:DNA photolyase family protein [Candidatus Eremiobacteraeota bacterium]
MKISLVWLRRDLRLHDNVAVFEACRASESVCLAFIIDPVLLRSDRVGAPIVQAFFDALAGLRTQVRALGSDLAILQGEPAAELTGLARRIGASAIFFNEDYVPEAIARDDRVSSELERAGLSVQSHLDHVYFGADEVLQQNGAPYKVFTPYKNRWLDQRQLARRSPVPSAEAFASKAIPAAGLGDTLEVPKLQDYGYVYSAAFPRVNELLARKRLAEFLASDGDVERYREDRNTPAIQGTSHLSPHLRAGTIGIRECVERAFKHLEICKGVARANVETWISELIWRDFYQMVLRKYPHVATRAFLEAGNTIAWRTSDADFAAWCEARTGYPLVDAAMKQLNTTGWMHNRLRMVVASFLTKDLLIDWRRGERYFEQSLADADLAQN